VHNYCTDQDYVIAVNPTSPLLATSTVQALLSSLPTRSPDTFFSVSEIKKHVLTPDGRSVNYRMWGPHPRTQDVSALCMLNWAFVGWKTNLVMNRITCRGDSLYQGDLMLCPISDVEATDIDTPMDWSIAESLAKYLSEERSREQPT
jgi:CMP-N-acetylneuraminic acid synthetase